MYFSWCRKNDLCQHWLRNNRHDDVFNDSIRFWRFGVRQRDSYHLHHKPKRGSTVSSLDLYTHWQWGFGTLDELIFIRDKLRSFMIIIFFYQINLLCNCNNRQGQHSALHLFRSSIPMQEPLWPTHWAVRNSQWIPPPESWR